MSSVIEVKREIILEEGVPVEIYDAEMNLLDETTALIGKATRQFFSEISLESHRQGQFLPELSVVNGLIVKNKVTEEEYIVVANYPEVIEQQKSATITRMIVCNSKLNVSRLVEDADRFGNIKREFKEIYSNLSVYIERIDSIVKQTDPGKVLNVTYKIYAPNIILDIEDQIQIDVGIGMQPLKLMGYDYTTFKGLTIIDAVTETRR